MLPLVASDHVDRLSNDIEMEVLPVILRIEIEVGIYETLFAGIEKCIYITLIPPSLLNRLEFRI